MPRMHFLRGAHGPWDGTGPSRALSRLLTEEPIHAAENGLAFPPRRPHPCTPTAELMQVKWAQGPMQPQVPERRLRPLIHSLHRGVTPAPRSD